MRGMLAPGSSGGIDGLDDDFKIGGANPSWSASS